jgi:Uncharacterized protein conserved in bacteria (DUF2059)
MRILGMMVMMFFLNLGLASAASINLTDGRVVQGDIIEQDNKSLKISVDGVAMTYYADEIKDIDGKPFAAPAPAAKPEAVANPVSASAPASVGGTIDEDKKALILKFIDVFGTRQALTNNFDLMLKQIEKEKPDEAQKIRQRVKVDEIIERLLPIYDRNFTSEDLKTFIAFYGSAEGQKLIGTIPELMKESVQESVKYMEEKFPEVKQAQ